MDYPDQRLNSAFTLVWARLASMFHQDSEKLAQKFFL